MAKRLQVILKDAEYREVEKAAKTRHVSIAQWVRDALDAARRREPSGDVSAKLQAVRASAAFAFPTSDIDQMLADIDAGYRG
jgi:hypothetical protein